jgi:hypothetical protein
MRSTLPTSHGFEPRSLKINSPFPKSAFADQKKTAHISNFEFVGTIDNAPYLCIPAAIAWRESLGGEKVVIEYNQELAKQAAKYVAKELVTEVMDNSTATLTQCCLTNVRLPLSVSTAQAFAAKAGVEETEVGGAVRDWMSKTFVDDYRTFIQSMFYGGAWWVRLSGQVYLEMADFEWATETLKKMCERVEAGEWTGK